MFAGGLIVSIIVSNLGDQLVSEISWGKSAWSFEVNTVVDVGHFIISNGVNGRGEVWLVGVWSSSSWLVLNLSEIFLDEFFNLFVLNVSGCTNNNVFGKVILLVEIFNDIFSNVVNVFSSSD